jgi:hypothetical protein
MKESSLGEKLRELCVELAEPSDLTYAEAFAHYGYVCPSEVCALENDGFSGGFVERFPGETWSFYSPKQVSLAEEHTGIDIRGTGLVPLVDCKDNQFICVRPSRNDYVVFSIEDDIIVSKADNLSEMLALAGLPLSD